MRQTCVAESPRRHRGTSWAILQIVFGLLLFLTLDATLFSPLGYLRWVSPDSGLGRFFYVQRIVAKDPGTDGGVIVFGDSRVAEGFSSVLATQEARRLGVQTEFLDSAVPGTSPRVWYYALRQYRDRGLRPAAVVFMAVNYEDGLGGFSPDHELDIANLHPYLGWRDAVTFSNSFRAPEHRWRALYAVFFKGWLYHADILDFLSDPKGRLKSVTNWRRDGKSYLDGYRGHEETLAGLTLDAQTGAIGWPQGSERRREEIARYAGRLMATRLATPQDAGTAEYDRFWYGAAAQLCREMGAKFIVFRAPRGPLHYLASQQADSHGALAELAKAGELTLIHADAFDDLEHPEFFFDELHMNRAGREAFSPRLARETLKLINSR